MECVSGPLKDKQGNIIGAVEIVRDETEQMRLSKQYATIKREMERQARFENIITQSKPMKSIFGLIEKIAPTNSTVLITGISSKTLKKFMDYPWPGNIRELENVIEYALHLAEDNHTIGEEHLPPRLLNKPAQEWSRSDLVSIEQFTRRSITALQSEHTEEQIAEILGISRKNLWEKRKRWGLQRPISARSTPKAIVS